MKSKKSFPLRINDEIMGKLKVISKENLRSVNKEIEFIIKKYIEKYESIQKKNQ